jgi:hypothetical protein
MQSPIAIRTASRDAGWQAMSIAGLDPVARAGERLDGLVHYIPGQPRRRESI